MHNFGFGEECYVISVDETAEDLFCGWYFGWTLLNLVCCLIVFGRVDFSVGFFYFLAVFDCLKRWLIDQ